MTARIAGRRYTVMGLGTRAGGVGVARFLAERGAIVTVTDGKTAQELAGPLAELADLPIRFVLGGHDEHDFTPDGADAIVRNPGVRRTSPFLRLARERGLPIEMEMSLFFRVCPAPIVGVTGTKGKTTTSSLCAAMLRARDSRTVMAGNMGVTALGQIDQITAETPVVLELSSWQLEALDEHRFSPRIAVLTNISEDHLDTYDSFAHYATTKRAIARHQCPSDVLVVNADDAEAYRAAAETPARVVPFGVVDRGGDGVWVTGDHLIRRDGEHETKIAIPANPALSGAHQAANIVAAAAAALVRGAAAEDVATGLHRFGGVRNRLEPIAEVDGVLFINDTAATAPAAVVAALNAYTGRPIRLIAGGADKRLDPRPLAAAVAAHAHAVYLLAGSGTGRLAELLAEADVTPKGPFLSMEDAVRTAARDAVAGDVILLSPGYASFGLFRDEFERGDRFREAVAGLRMSVNEVAT